MRRRVEDVVIVGAGIAGLATALALKRAGVEALVLEKSEELRATGAALTLFPNAWFALDALGVSQKLTSRYSPSIRARLIDLDSGTTREASLASPNPDLVGPISVHRRALLEALADELPVQSIRFSCKITAIDTQQREGSSIAIVHLGDGTTIKAKVLIGCDGVHSVVSRWLGLTEPFHTGRSAARGLSVYPQGHGIMNQDVTQYVGYGRRAGFVALNDKEIYWFFICTSKGADLSEDPKDIQRELMENYAKDLSPVYLDIVKNTDLSTLTWAPLLSRYPWHVVLGKLSRQNVTVVGDAMHPMTPDLAQGACAALEDAVILGRHIGTSFKQHGGELVSTQMAGAIEEYVKERRWRAALLIAASYFAGWVQQAWSGNWGIKIFRDFLFYKFLYLKFLHYVHFDCGKIN